MTRVPPTTKLAIALDELRALMREFIDDRKQYGEQVETELTLELFLQWVKQRRERDKNVLTFREKETSR